MTNNKKTDKVISMEDFNSTEEHLGTDSEIVLNSALTHNLDEVIVCGVKDQKFFISSSCDNVQSAVFLAQLFSNSMFNGVD